MKAYRDERWTLLNGGCFEVLKRLPSDRFDSVVTDPPYGLGKPPPMEDALRAWLAGERYEARDGGFMGQAWDAFVPGPEVWREVLRVLKPGGHLLAFFGSRTFDLGTAALRLAGFEVRDTLSWMYGTGFPKSLDVSKAIDAAAGVDHDTPSPHTEAARQWEGWGTALKPAWEPIVLARKPLDGTVARNVQQWGTGALNIDGCRIEGSDGYAENRVTQGINTARTSYAPAVRRKTFEPSNIGRWPANVLLDEHAAQLLDAQTGTLKSGAMRAGTYAGRKSAVYAPDAGRDIIGSEGGASRFFYTAKASRAERDTGCEALPARTGGEATGREDESDGLQSPRAGAGRGGGARNHHPTVKPIVLMRWLVRLVTPPGGVVLDPFVGSGSTGVAALQEGFTFVGVEREADYIEIALARLRHAAEASK